MRKNRSVENWKQLNALLGNLAATENVGFFLIQENLKVRKRLHVK